MGWLRPSHLNAEFQMFNRHFQHFSPCTVLSNNSGHFRGRDLKGLPWFLFGLDYWLRHTRTWHDHLTFQPHDHKLGQGIYPSPHTSSTHPETVGFRLLKCSLRSLVSIRHIEQIYFHCKIQHYKVWQQTSESDGVGGGKDASERSTRELSDILFGGVVKCSKLTNLNT